MAEQAQYSTTAEIPVDAGHGHKKAGPVDVKPSLIALTYITFVITAVVLYKVAWKPILALLDKREETLRQSVDDAEKLKQELATISQQREEILSSAEQQARELIDKGRQAAADAARAIEDKAREESQILLENARREIKAESDKARAALRRESAELAVGISRKILLDGLDENRSRDLADRMIAQL
ncbi:MAG: F0F1 ATP synthase subunit B [Kiritimatiellia bacterium]|jgi:F-type H+-transporting ATPase subunit b